MKVRLVKLREAHKASGNGTPSFCSVAWDRQARHVITAAASDAVIAIHDVTQPSSAPRLLRHHRDGVTAVAVSPNSTCLASGSVDHSVKLYKFPGGEFESNITRFTLPIRVLAFNRSGTILAAAGDDEGIKLINTVDGSIARVFKAHKGSVTGLDFDPSGEYLASIDSTGSLVVWDLITQTALHTQNDVAPDLGLDPSVKNVLSYSPDGKLLAVPGLKNEIVMYDRHTLAKQFSLRGDHTRPICFFSWSPNGKYMATASLDKQVLIWDIAKKQDIDRQKFDERISCLAWNPIGNSLAVIDVMGKYGIWESVIPSSMKSPSEDIPNSDLKNGVSFFDEEEDREEPAMSNSLSDLGEDSFGEPEPTRRKRLRNSSEFEDELNDDEGDEVTMRRPKYRHKLRKEDDNQGQRGKVASSKLKMQDAFQPGSTPSQPEKRRFLCYNMLGSITSMEHDGYSHIEIDFHDTSSGPRVPSMNDHFGFTMASLNEKGSVFANPCKGEKNMSTLMYRPFGSWATNSEWSMRFEGEEVKVVALGTSWVAAITNLNFLRIFTEAGLQKHVLCLDGPVVTASGFKDELAIVTHSADCLPSDNQMLEFKIYNIANGTQGLRGRLPITPASNLVWFGFSEEGQLSSYDSKGVLRVFTQQFGGCWLPLFSPSKENKSERHWVVGLSASKLFCIVCKLPDLFPQVMPKPVLTLLDLSFPLASSDLGADTLENEFMLNNMHLSQIQKQIEELSDVRLCTITLEDEAFNIEAAQDKCILRLIGSCCNGDKLARATELVKLLTLEKSVRGAIKLVTVLKLPSLAERFNNILMERLRNESQTAAQSQTILRSSVRNDTMTRPPASARKNCEVESETGKSEPNQATFVDDVGKVRVDEVENDGNCSLKRPQRPLNPFAKKASDQEKTGERDQAQAQPSRPSNPFLKSIM